MQQRNTITVEEATKKLEYYCAYQERCYAEVEQKLNSLQLIPEAKAKILEHLITENYINEERFAKAFARGKFRIKKWGKRRIANQLKQRQVSKYNINAALNEIPDAEYLEAFNKLAEKRYKEIKENNSAMAKKKLLTYLQYRGWETHLIFEKLTDLFK